MIVKVQRPLFPVDAPCLIYNKAKTVMQTRYISNKDLAKMGSDMKAYFQAKNENGKITLITRVPNEEW